jgi:hypothetical protein
MSKPALARGITFDGSVELNDSSKPRQLGSAEVRKLQQAANIWKRAEKNSNESPNPVLVRSTLWHLWKRKRGGGGGGGLGGGRGGGG